ncbi:cytochrome P450 [Limibacillus sp. MBR-115]|uniref:cytochrome P450 n=1 Tax=Limibacillus sp. MBR-115 TaxID=3156465 RepID=UPI0033910B67
MTPPNTMGSHKTLNSLEEEVRATLEYWTGEDSVYWSVEREAWVVTGYAEAAKMLEDSSVFWRDVSNREGSSEFWGRHLMMLEGRDHRRMHALHMQLTGEAFAESIRERVSEICHDICAELVRQGEAELGVNYADLAVLLSGCDFMGYGTSDRSMIESLEHQMGVRAKWKEALLAGDGIPLDSKIAQEGQAALDIIRSALLPIIKDRREQPHDDLISAMWQKGPSVFPDWNEDDIFNAGWSCLDNEGKPLLRGLLYILCRDLELQEKLRRNPSLVAGFVEEGLRFLSPLRTMRRVAKKDVEIGGQKILSGDSIYLITPLANRDEERWGCPHSFEAERMNKTTNLAFGYGPGYCVGRYVGRMENEEAIKAILAEATEFSLNPARAKPEWMGDFAHSVWPIHAILK